LALETHPLEVALVIDGASVPDGKPHVLPLCEVVDAFAQPHMPVAHRLRVLSRMNSQCLARSRLFAAITSQQIINCNG